MGEGKEFRQAKDYAYKLLSYRQRSTKEIKERLKKKGFTCGTIKKTIEYLIEFNYLNDENFARFWIQAKLQSRPVGWSLLRYQLRQKGIAEEILDEALSEYAPQYNEKEAARQIAFSRRNRYKNIAPQKLNRRLYDYLCRRGFSQEAIAQALEQKK